MPFNLTGTGQVFSAAGAGKFDRSMTAGTAVSSVPVVTAGAFTANGWVKATQVGLHICFAQGGLFWVGIDGSGNLKATYGDGGPQVQLSTSTRIDDGVFHHVEICVDSSGGKLFCDGVLVASSTTTPASAGVLYTGTFEMHGPAGTYGWVGEVDEVAVYGTVLHTANFTLPTAPVDNAAANLIAVYHLDNDLLDSKTNPATAVTLSGPASGPTSAASGAFTAAANGIITGTVIVTPSDGGAGGTFTPSTVSISSGTPSATFTYTAASNGAKTISATNNGSLTNPGTITYTSAVAPTGALTSTGAQVGQSKSFTFSTANVPTSGVATMTPAATPNGAVLNTGTVTLGSNTGTASFVNIVPGDYVLSITVTNGGGSNAVTGTGAVNITVPATPTIAITGQAQSGTSVIVNGTYTGYPASGTVVLTASGTPNGAVTTSARPITFNGDGTWTCTLTSVSYGNYASSTASATNYGGTGTATGPAISTYAPGSAPPGLPAVAVPPYVPATFNAPSVANGGTITTLTLENTTASTATNQPFTVGLPFKKGQIKTTDSLIGKISGQSDIALQFDPRSTWPDGSVMHGVVSGVLPTIAANALAVMAVTRSTVARDTTTASYATVAASAANVSTTAVIAGVTYSADLDAALTAGTGIVTWLAGPVVTEYAVEVPFKNGATPHASLKARFAVRHYGSAGTKVDVTVEHCDAYGNTATLTYDAAISVGGATVYTKSALAHYFAARWKKTFWHATTAALHVKFDTAHLLDSKTLPNYDRTIVVSETTLNQRYTVDSYNTEPMGNGQYNPDMGSTGGRPELALHPRWCVDWILTQDKRARKFALLHADIGGSWDVHHRDRSTGPAASYPIDSLHWPYVTKLGSASDSLNPATGQQEKLAFGSTGPSMVAKTDHKPAFANVAYLLTGDVYYLEEVMFWAAFSSWEDNPYYRGFERGLLSPGQVRGQAWGLRDYAFAAAMLPDSHPQKPTYQYLTNTNFDWYNEQYTDNGSANAFGTIVNGYALAYNSGRAVSTWQDDFITSVTGQCTDLGFAKAGRFLLWKAKFPVSRLIAPGYCWIFACTYGLTIKAADGTAYTTFAQAYNNTVSAAMLTKACGSQAMADQLTTEFGRGFIVGEMPDFSTSVEGYPSNMQPGIAAAVDSGYTNADLAWMQFESRTRKADYSLGAQFAVVPRAVTVVADTTAPVPVSAAVSNSTPTVVNITMSEAMDTGSVPATSAFTVSGHTVTAVAISGSTINLTLSAPFVFGEATRTVGYTQPGTNNARDLATTPNLLANFSGQAITNNVGSSIVVSVTPNFATVAQGASVTFIASVTGGGSVTWTAVNATVNSSGVVSGTTAGLTEQFGQVRATSTVDATKFGTASFNIPALPSVGGAGGYGTTGGTSRYGGSKRYGGAAKAGPAPKPKPSTEREAKRLAELLEKSERGEKKE